MWTVSGPLIRLIVAVAHICLTKLQKHSARFPKVLNSDFSL